MGDMHVTILSMFNDATGYLDRYLRQVVALQARLESMDLLLVEGDSTDETWTRLHEGVAAYGVDATIWQHHHGEPLRRGTGHPARLANLSRIWNEMLDAVTAKTDVAIIVESDLVWTPGTLVELIQRMYTDFHVRCSMVWLDDLFYDVYLYRRNGQKFTNHPPYHPDLEIGKPLVLDSAGSCLVMPGHLAREHRTTPEGELMGMCHSVRKAGYKVILESDLHIYQPKSEWAGIQAFRGVA